MGSGWGSTITLAQTARVLTVEYAFFTRGDMQPPVKFTLSSTRCRTAHVYVFALHGHKERLTADPLDLSQWEFYVAPTALLNERCGDQKGIRLASLRRHGVTSVAWADLNSAIAKAMTAS